MSVINRYGNEIAPMGQVYICQACGKQSPDLYGTSKLSFGRTRSFGWDETCILNAVLCDVKTRQPMRREEDDVHSESY